MGTVQLQTKGFDALASQWHVEKTIYQQQKRQWTNRDRTCEKLNRLLPEDSLFWSWTKFQPKLLFQMSYQSLFRNERSKLLVLTVECVHPTKNLCESAACRVKKMDYPGIWTPSKLTAAFERMPWSMWPDLRNAMAFFPTAHKYPSNKCPCFGSSSQHPHFHLIVTYLYNIPLSSYRWIVK